MARTKRVSQGRHTPRQQLQTKLKRELSKKKPATLCKAFTLVAPSGDKLKFPHPRSKSLFFSAVIVVTNTQ